MNCSHSVSQPLSEAAPPWACPQWSFLQDHEQFEPWLAARGARRRSSPGASTDVLLPQALLFNGENTCVVISCNLQSRHQGEKWKPQRQIPEVKAGSSLAAAATPWGQNERGKAGWDHRGHCKLQPWLQVHQRPPAFSPVYGSADQKPTRRQNRPWVHQMPFRLRCPGKSQQIPFWMENSIRKSTAHHKRLNDL